MNLVQPHYIDPRQGEAQLSLNGVWQYGYQDAVADTPETLSCPFQANLPDSLFWNLADSHVLTHPYIGTNSKQYHWVDEKVWYFRRTFSVDSQKRGTTAILCFDGVAYYSRFWLNGVLLGEHEGMFGGPYAAVSKLLRYDAENELIVEIKACNFGKKDTYDGRNLQGGNREIVPWNIARDDHTSNGDFIVMGIWRDIRLEFLPPLHLARPYLVTKSIGDGQAVLQFETEIISPQINELHPCYGTWDDHDAYNFAYMDGLKQAYLSQDASIRIALFESHSDVCAFDCTTPFSLIDYTKSLRAPDYPESQFFQQELTLKNPKLWWPHDMGDPACYEARVSLLIGGEAADTVSFRFGVRTIEIVPTAGPKARERWSPFQFIINHQPVFLKGVNYMATDVLYRETEAEHRWTLQLVRNAGIHMLRVWSGGGKPESDIFYNLCDEMGIMVWQDHMIANTSHTEGWPLDVLEAQVGANLYRIRNHPSLAVHCGGNEFNAYSAGNAASMHIISRTVQLLDPSRTFYNTTPDGGSAHIYRDMEPTWYRHLYKDLPFVAETGIHSMPSFKAMRECLPERECLQQLPSLTSETFQTEFPGLLNHFAEYVPSRVPRMLARASQITDLGHVTLADLAEATQMASFEYYAILIQSLRENYPVTAGLMPWVFRRTWTTVGIQLVDGSGEPVAPYYALKNSYTNRSAHIALEHISYAPRETLSIPVRLCNEYALPWTRYQVEVALFSPAMSCVWSKTVPASAADGLQLDHVIPDAWTDQFFFLTVTLQHENAVELRQVYWPKCLSKLSNDDIRSQYRTAPQHDFYFENGPWLKQQVSQCAKASLKASVRHVKRNGLLLETELLLTNTSAAPAFPVWLQSNEPNVQVMMQDNWFWLAPGESRALQATLRSTNPSIKPCTLAVSAWNAPAIEVSCNDNNGLSV